MTRTRLRRPCRWRWSMEGWHRYWQDRASAFVRRRAPSAMRARGSDNDDERSASWRDVHERDALRHGGTLLKPERLRRRMPPTTTPARQATGGTHTTEPYSIPFDTPAPPPPATGHHPQ